MGKTKKATTPSDCPEAGVEQKPAPRTRTYPCYKVTRTRTVTASQVTPTATTHHVMDDPKPLCDERFTWLTVLTRTPVLRVTVAILMDPMETLVSLVSPLFGHQRWNLVNMRKHLNGSEHLCIFVFFTLLVSISVGTIQRSLACPCASVDTHQSRSVVKFCVAQFLRCCVSFSSVLSRDGIFALL